MRCIGEGVISASLVSRRIARRWERGTIYLLLHIWAPSTRVIVGMFLNYYTTFGRDIDRTLVVCRAQV